MPADEIAFAAPTGLTATLAGPFDIDLRWKDNASEEGGYFIEYANHPEDGFILLAAVSQDGTAFRHADLVPETRFIYRVRPFFGRASKVAEVRTGKAAAEDAAGALEEPTPGPPGDKPLRTTSGSPKPRQPISVSGSSRPPAWS